MKLLEESTITKGVFAKAADYLYPPENELVSDPARWLHDKCGRCLWSKQVEILNSVRDHRLTAVQSCHGPGKSFTGSGVVSHFLDVHELGSAFAVTTAPSWPQVEAILWREIRRRHREGRLRGRITLDCMWHMGELGSKRADSSEELIAMGRKPADYDEDTFQGIHSRFFLALIDEACGVPESLKNSCLALVTNENARVLALGNPDDPNSWFAKACKPGSGWNVIKISVWDTPLFTNEDHCAVCGGPLPQDMLESLVSPLWVDMARQEWGEGSPLWQSKVEGEFPDVSDEYLITPAMIERAWRTELSGLEDGRYALDVARYGEDKSVVYRDRGGQIRFIKEWAKLDTMRTVGNAINVLKLTPLKRLPMNIDIIGVGAGVYDRMREQRYNVGPYQGSQAATNPAKFLNRRSESWWTFRQELEDGLIDLDENDVKLAGELQSVKWGINSSGRIFIESKEDMRERGVKSPNRADAAVMSRVVVGAVPERGKPSTSVTADLLTKRM